MKILVYDDNTDYGGHQAMACHGIDALAEMPGINIECMINPANGRLAERLKNQTVLDAPATAGEMARLKPDIMLCIQGDLGQSTRGIAAAHKAGIECISYLALPHTLQRMGAKLGALRDRFNNRLLNAPSRYIVISESMRKILLDRGAGVPIEIVPNGISVPQSLKPKEQSLSQIGVLGRVEFKQKQQDFMVDTFLRYPDIFDACRLLIAGSGPDRERLARRVAGKNNIELLPWQDDTESFYNAIDLLVIPSRFEGVPLVMLEALARGIPVIGSRCDGMRDTLPDAWTFEPGNAAALAETFSRVRTSWRNDIDALQEKVAADTALETFKQRFCTAVIGSR